jgi:hypothetical protein
VRSEGRSEEWRREQKKEKWSGAKRKTVKGRGEKRREKIERKSTEKQGNGRGEKRTGKREEQIAEEGLCGIDDGVFGEEGIDGVRECVAVAISWSLFGWKCA